MGVEDETHSHRIGVMDSNFPSPPPDNVDAKNAFRKPSGDAANRNYRRRSPVDGSPSSAGSPKRELSSSPNQLTGDPVRVSENHSRKDGIKEQDRHYSRNHSSRSGDSLRHSDRQSSRSSHGHTRHDKYGDEDRYRDRLSSRSGHESRGDHMKEENDSRSKDYSRTMDKYSRDKYDRSDYRSKEKDRETSSLEYQKYKDNESSYDRTGSGRRHASSDEVERERHTRDRDGRDERRDSRRTSGDYRSDWAASYSESRNHREDSGSRRDSGKHRLKEGHKSEQKDLNGQKLPLEEKKKYDDYDMGRDKDRSTRKAGEQFGHDDKESSAKKPKLFDVDKDDNYGKDVGERQISSAKLVEESKVDLGTAQASGSEGGSDLNAAKVAAMKAAELVNKNLVGAGCLTTDQKKKLLWGNKKNTTAEESGHRWETALFSDRERQEKFNKLMGVKGDAKVEQISKNQSGNDPLYEEKQRELQLDLEKQYTAGLRRRDGRTVGLGL
ncbi:hypothetical protein L6164_009302 [Bauhinia variegata]|uniref:Uncharacterized protein n=1 Tax=Bauhinia variegata TaxID=167791 RepID=A0ACB9PKW3_BAUVA|nr:hypothetical protein L6164_009302 [Bauhinia variegata]